MDGGSHEDEGSVTRLSALRSQVRELEVFVDGVVSSSGQKPEFREIEREIRERAAGVERAATAAALAAYEPDAEEVEFEGRRYRRMSQPTEATYWGMAGGLRVPRYLFREVGVRNGPTIVPLELAAGIVDGRLTPEAAQASAFLMQALPSREAEEVTRRFGVLQQSRTTLARTGEMLGQRWEDNRLEGEDQLMGTFEVYLVLPSPTRGAGCACREALACSPRRALVRRGSSRGAFPESPAA